MRVDLNCGLLLTILVLQPVPNALADAKDPKPEVLEAETPKQERRSERRAQAPSTNFTPTEKIKADSAVSFPVDI